MDVEELIRRWGARRAGLPLEDVLRVEFIHEDGGPLSELTYEDPYDEIRVHVRGGGWVTRDLEDGCCSVPEIIREILELDREGTDGS